MTEDEAPAEAGEAVGGTVAASMPTNRIRVAKVFVVLMAAPFPTLQPFLTPACSPLAIDRDRPPQLQYRLGIGRPYRLELAGGGAAQGSSIATLTPRSGFGLLVRWSWS